MTSKLHTHTIAYLGKKSPNGRTYTKEALLQILEKVTGRPVTSNYEAGIPSICHTVGVVKEATWLASTGHLEVQFEEIEGKWTPEMGQMVPVLNIEALVDGDIVREVTRVKNLFLAHPEDTQWSPDDGTVPIVGLQDLGIDPEEVERIEEGWEKLHNPGRPRGCLRNDIEDTQGGTREIYKQPPPRNIQTSLPKDPLEDE